MGPGSFSVSGGVVFDGNGNIGTYGTLYGGLGTGLDASIGVAVGGSNAPTIDDLNGPFGQVSGNFGAGVDVGGSSYVGATSSGQPIAGVEASLGAGLGAGFSGGGSDTIVFPIGISRKTSQPAKACPR